MDRVTVAASESSPFIGRPQPLRHRVGVGRWSGRPGGRATGGHERNGRKIGILILVVGLTASACTASASGTPSKSNRGTAGAPLPASTLAKVQQTVRQFKDDGKHPWSAGRHLEPEGNLCSADGVANLTTGEPLRTDMQFKIASQTKAFTADLILQLIGEGKVSFDDHISRWVAGVPNGDQITIRELLNMTSGLQTGFLVEEANVNKLATGCTEADVLAAGAAQAPLSPPGTKWSYSNYGYDLLGRVVELVTGENVSTAIQQRIARPLGLHRTFLPTSGNGLSVALHSRVRHRGGSFHPGAGGCLRRCHRLAPVVRRGVRRDGLHAVGPARLVSSAGNRCPAQAGGLERGTTGHDPLRLLRQLQRSRPLAPRTGLC